MDESMAWLYQASADRAAAEHYLSDEASNRRCHAIAQWQQSVEKAIKAIVVALREARVLSFGIRPKHEVEPYVRLLVRLPRPDGNRTIQTNLHILLDQKTRSGISALDRLVPKMPTGRNTEYPFRDAADQWTYPAAIGVFSDVEIENFRSLAHRVLDGAWRVVSAVRRRPS